MQDAHLVMLRGISPRGRLVCALVIPTILHIQYMIDADLDT